MLLTLRKMILFCLNFQKWKSMIALTINLLNLIETIPTMRQKKNIQRYREQKISAASYLRKKNTLKIRQSNLMKKQKELENDPKMKDKI